MFTKENFSNSGIEYDYAALNRVLLSRVDEDSATLDDDIKNASDSINDSMIESDGQVWVWGVVVGRVLDEEDVDEE